DKESRGAERAARDRLLGITQQPLFDGRILNALEHVRAIEAGGAERRLDHLGVVHLLRLLPHVVERSLDIVRRTPSISAAIAPRIICSVLTGKNGLRRKLVMPCRRMKRSVSSLSYSGLFLIPFRLSAGERLLVNLNTPPSRIGT